MRSTGETPRRNRMLAIYRTLRSDVHDEKYGWTTPPLSPDDIEAILDEGPPRDPCRLPLAEEVAKSGKTITLEQHRERVAVRALHKALIRTPCDENGCLRDAYRYGLCKLHRDLQWHNRNREVFCRNHYSVAA